MCFDESLICSPIACSFEGYLILSYCRLVFSSSFSSPSNGVSIQTLWQINTESQGYLDELASDGKTTPRAPLTRSSTFRFKCGDDGFHHVSLMFHTIRVRETYTEHARRCLVSPTLETTSPARRRFSSSGFSVRCPAAAVAMNYPSASRLSSSPWGVLS